MWAVNLVTHCGGLQAPASLDLDHAVALDAREVILVAEEDVAFPDAPAASYHCKDVAQRIVLHRVGMHDGADVKSRQLLECERVTVRNGRRCEGDVHGLGPEGVLLL
jgi:hypothetical protein